MQKANTPLSASSNPEQENEFRVRGIPFAEIEITYRIMLKRIAAGYSAEELSFLMGKPAGYISSRESLKQQGYSVQELNRIARIMDDDSFRSYFPSGFEGLQELNVCVKRTKTTGIIFHEVSEIRKDDSSCLLYKIFEDNPGTIAYPESEERDTGRLKAAVSLLLRLGYFEEKRTALQIFRRCGSILNEDLRPGHLEKALNFYLRDQRPAVLKRYTAKEEYVYKQNIKIRNKKDISDE